MTKALGLSDKQLAEIQSAAAARNFCVMRQQ
jgi:hypothetical protein